MAEKKNEKSPAKKPGKMCDQCELIGGFPGRGSERFKLLYAEYRVRNIATGFEMFLCRQHRQLLLPRAHKLPNGRWAVEGRISELVIEELDTAAAEE